MLVIWKIYLATPPHPKRTRKVTPPPLLLNFSVLLQMVSITDHPHPTSGIHLTGIRTFWHKKSKEKLTKLINILNYIKSLCTIFLVKMFRYSHYIYYLQEESTHFHRRVLINFGQSIRTFWTQKITQEKSTKIIKIF